MAAHLSRTIHSLAAIASACALVACASPAKQAVVLKGVVAASAFIPGSSTDPNIKAGYYQGALVCVDANGNGKCDPSENSATTDSEGAFTLNAAAAGPLIADIGTSARNTATGAAVPSRLVLRASVAQEKDQGDSNIVISAMSSEVQRLVEANGTTYSTEKANLAARLYVDSHTVLANVNTVAGVAQTRLLAEDNELTHRYTYATLKFDRGDRYPDALAVPGGDPELTRMTNVTATTASATKADTRKPITFAQAQQAAFNVEGIPRYDNIFIVMLENKGTSSIAGSPYAPKINKLMKTGNSFTTYFSTGNPSEPNYTALGGGDDWGLTDDSAWVCFATGANAITDLPIPASTVSTPLDGTQSLLTACRNSNANTDHNIVGKPNLFNAITAAGMTWRTYSESMNPGQDVRVDGIADSAVTAHDHVYPPGMLGGNTSVVGSSTRVLPMPAGLYKTKHHPGMPYENVRSAPEFKFSNRTLGGGQWDANLSHEGDYKYPAGYVVDQFGADLQSGDVGNLNFLIPDQCDDMHGIKVTGTDGSAASDCRGSAIIARGDNYVDKLVNKIEASPLWANRQKKVAIVLMFDEGKATNTATDPFNSCCGWNKANSTAAEPLVPNGGGYTRDSSIVNYTRGNRGHGNSIFIVLTNQPNAPKGIQDSDAYSHFSFVRTLQDMFQLSDPQNDESYIGRSKYTEKFIAQHILNLPEYARSADSHFDSVRPMNHAYVIPAGFTAKQSNDIATAPQVGPDRTQANIWAIH